MEASIRLLDEQKPPLGETIFILEVTPDWPQPNAKYRARFGDLRDKLKWPMIFALISPSALIRGVTIAVNWISPPKRGMASAFAGIEDAVTAIDKRLGREAPASQIQRLHAQVSKSGGKR